MHRNILVDFFLCWYDIVQRRNTLLLTIVAIKQECAFISNDWRLETIASAASDRCLYTIYCCLWLLNKFSHIFVLDRLREVSTQFNVMIVKSKLFYKFPQTRWNSPCNWRKDSWLCSENPKRFDEFLCVWKVLNFSSNGLYGLSIIYS